MTDKLMNAAGQQVTLIGGTTAYVRVSPSVAGVTDGRSVNLPISFDFANFTASIYTKNAIARPSVSRGENGICLVRILPEHTTALANDAAMTEITLELKAVLTAPIPNTSYIPGDTLGFRWLVYMSPALR